jgi:hypothetical protein
VPEVAIQANSVPMQKQHAASISEVKNEEGEEALPTP